MHMNKEFPSSPEVYDYWMFIVLYKKRILLSRNLFLAEINKMLIQKINI